MFSESRTIDNASYTFAGDLNGDGFNNDLIYFPRDTSEMNFQTHTVGTGATARTFTAAEQAAAWDAFIQQDDYLSQHRGEYARRGSVLLPVVSRTDVAIAQDVFVNLAGRRHSFQVRADILNFGNLLNSDWGVGQRLVTTQPLLVPTAAQGGPADAQGRAWYRLRSINNELIGNSLEQSLGSGDVYGVQFSLRYSF